MHTFHKILLISFISIVLLACSDNSSYEPSKTASILNTTQKIKEITVNDLSEKYLDEHLIIDVRELNELSAGMIPNAIHIPMGEIATVLPGYIQQNFQDEKNSELKRKPILLYCGSGRRSYNSAETLQKLGFTDVTSLDGGFNAYKQSKY